MGSLKAWIASHHSAVFATIVAVQNMHVLKGTSASILSAIGGLFSAF